MLPAQPSTLLSGMMSWLWPPGNCGGGTGEHQRCLANNMRSLGVQYASARQQLVPQPVRPSRCSHSCLSATGHLRNTHPRTADFGTRPLPLLWKPPHSSTGAVAGCTRPPRRGMLQGPPGVLPCCNGCAHRRGTFLRRPFLERREGGRRRTEDLNPSLQAHESSLFSFLGRPADLPSLRCERTGAFLPQQVFINRFYTYDASFSRLGFPHRTWFNLLQRFRYHNF